MNRILSGFLAVLLLGGNAQAGPILGLDFAMPLPHLGGNSIWNLGWSFTVTQPVTVVGLGDADVMVNGFVSPQNPTGANQQVGLWDSQGHLLASTFVSGSDPLAGVDGNWRFHSIAPVHLTVGQTYIVGGQGGAAYSSAVAVNVNPRLTFIQGLFSGVVGGSNSPLMEPTTASPGGFDTTSSAGFFGGNIELDDPAPEPSSLALVVLGAFGLIGAGLLVRSGIKSPSSWAFIGAGDSRHRA